jgi:hypothetical protein
MKPFQRKSSSRRIYPVIFSGNGIPAVGYSLYTVIAGLTRNLTRPVMAREMLNQVQHDVGRENTSLVKVKQRNCPPSPVIARHEAIQKHSFTGLLHPCGFAMTKNKKNQRVTFQRVRNDDNKYNVIARSEATKQSTLLIIIN